MFYFFDHATYCRSICQRTATADLVQAETDKGRALIFLTADRAAYLRYSQRLARRSRFLFLRRSSFLFSYRCFFSFRRSFLFGSSSFCFRRGFFCFLFNHCVYPEKLFFFLFVFSVSTGFTAANDLTHFFATLCSNGTR